MPGIEGSTRFSTNSLGIRGDEISDTDHYRILCIGGSTTECIYLDDDTAWPALLDKYLNRTCGSHGKIWVGNTGRSALNTLDHIIQMKCQVPTLPRIDCVVLLIGINDCVQTLRGSPDAFDPEKKQDKLFMNVGENDFSARPIGQSAIGALPRLLRGIWRSEGYQDYAAEFYVRERRQRASARRIVDTLPNLDFALKRYRHSLRRIKQIADTRHWRLVLMTQPTMWKEGLTNEEKALLWLGDVRDSQGKTRAYYSVAALGRAMDLFNSTLGDFCAVANIECIDLADQVPKSTKAFYDDCHFNEAGARVVAKLICDHLGESICSHISNSSITEATISSNHRGWGE